jgi:hypothetical protein
MRAAERCAHVVANRATSFDDAERWDLQYWLQKTPQERLSALMAIHSDIAKVGHDGRR